MSILAIALNPTIDISSSAKRIVPTHKIRTHNQRWHAGGGGVNVARVIKILGGQPELLITSGGIAGAILEEELKPSGIDLFIIELKSPTRIAYMVYEEETGQEFRFVPEGPEVNERQYVQILEAVRQHLGDYVVASGSLPPGVPADAYAQMATVAGQTNSRFILDTSGDALRAALEARTNMYLLKPSISELESYAGHSLDKAGASEVALDLIAKRAAQHIALTLGEEGAILFSSDGAHHMPALKIEVQSAVGAGDSFVGGMVYKLMEGADIMDAFKYGMVVGAASAMTAGTELCHMEDIQRLQRQLV